MSVTNTERHWGWPARALHWIMALMIFALLGIGFWMSNVETDLATRFQMTQTHKSVGFVVFVLAVLRVGWRLANPTPQLPSRMPAWQRRASHASHWALYALIFLMPLSGWLMATSSPLNDPGAYPTQIRNEVFGLFAMPDPFPQGSEALTEAFHTAHVVFALTLAGILLVHMGAALRHQFVDRDGLLSRMVTGRAV